MISGGDRLAAAAFAFQSAYNPEKVARSKHMAQVASRETTT
jgi:hypothetical protein